MNNLKYIVEQRYYSNGVVDAYIREVPDIFQDEWKEGPVYDLYIDVFDTEEEAEACLKECLEA